MEHRINIENKIDHQTIVQGINKEFSELPPLPSDIPCIYKVNEALRISNPKAYTPMLVSIGPYNHQNRQKAMEDHKLRYLQSFLGPRHGGMEKYILAVEELEDGIRGCYADPINLKKEEFVKMMLLDGCFIIEFFRKWEGLVETSRNDPIFKMAWMCSQIRDDILLLENQLPFCFLSKLYDMIDPQPNVSLVTLAESVLKNMVPMECLQPTSSVGNHTSIKHLLDLACILCYSRPECTSSEGSLDENKNILTATELQEAGVKFNKFDNNKELDPRHQHVSLFDIKFDKGLLKIPCLKVDDSTETLFRNLIAYEQHSEDGKPKYFTDYACFMNQLVNSEEDAKLLRQHEIIKNSLGDDKAVSQLFNKLGDGVVNSPAHFYNYYGVCKKVNKHCTKTWSRARAKLRHDYFNNPWAGVSTLAATILLIFTIISTLVTVGVSQVAASILLAVTIIVNVVVVITLAFLV